MRAALQWLVDEWQWPAAGLLGAVLLAPLVAVLIKTAGWPLGLVALQLPLYLIHQAEEHLGDRFRLHVNRMVGGEALSRPATFWINALGVWLVDAVALAGMVFVAPSWGLVAIYLTLVNALVHLVAGVVKRESNPGLVTALLLFLPLGGLSLFSISRSYQFSVLAHVESIGLVLLIHAAIIAWVVRGARRIRA